MNLRNVIIKTKPKHSKFEYEYENNNIDQSSHIDAHRG